MSGLDNDNTDHYEGALLEAMNERLKGILEGQESLAHVPAKLDDISNRLERVESKIDVIEAAV